MNFHHFANIKGHQDQQKVFFFSFTFLYFQKDIILQWVLGLVTKIYKYFNNFLPLYMAKYFYG
jgi:hypothetical protein